MVTVLAARWRLGSRLYRETGDVDLGIPPVVARDECVVGRLKDIAYEQIAGNRFARGLPDIPAGLTGDSAPGSRQAPIDVLGPRLHEPSPGECPCRGRPVHHAGPGPAACASPAGCALWPQL